MHATFTSVDAMSWFAIALGGVGLVWLVRTVVGTVRYVRRKAVVRAQMLAVLDGRGEMYELPPEVQEDIAIVRARQRP